MDQKEMQEQAYKRGYEAGRKDADRALRAELMDERYRHDRLQDFEVAEAKELADAKKELMRLRGELERPLTLEELKTMHGIPVYIEDWQRDSHGWELSEDASDYFEDHEESDYGSAWIAYRCRLDYLWTESTGTKRKKSSSVLSRHNGQMYHVMLMTESVSEAEAAEDFLLSIIKEPGCDNG